MKLWLRPINEIQHIVCKNDALCVCICLYAMHVSWGGGCIKYLISYFIILFPLNWVDAAVIRRGANIDLHLNVRVKELFHCLHSWFSLCSLTWLDLVCLLFYLRSKWCLKVVSYVALFLSQCCHWLEFPSNDKVKWNSTWNFDFLVFPLKQMQEWQFAPFLKPAPVFESSLFLSLIDILEKDRQLLTMYLARVRCRVSPLAKLCRGKINPSQQDPETPRAAYEILRWHLHKSKATKGYENNLTPICCVSEKVFGSILYCHCFIAQWGALGQVESS